MGTSPTNTLSWDERRQDISQDSTLCELTGGYIDYLYTSRVLDQ